MSTPPRLNGRSSANQHAGPHHKIDGSDEAALLRLLPLWPHEAADRSAAGRGRLRSCLRRALRAERRRGLAGHWTYDLSRHAQLLALYRRECGHKGGPD